MPSVKVSHIWITVNVIGEEKNYVLQKSLRATYILKIADKYFMPAYELFICENNAPEQIYSEQSIKHITTTPSLTQASILELNLTPNISRTDIAYPITPSMIGRTNSLSAISWNIFSMIGAKKKYTLRKQKQTRHPSVVSHISILINDQLVNFSSAKSTVQAT